MLLYVVPYHLLSIAQLSCPTSNEPSPGMYAVITVPLLNLTLAVLRSPEFGFFGFVVPTRRQTPFSSGVFTKAGEVALRAFCPVRHPRRTWLYVACVLGVLEKDRRVDATVKTGLGAIKAPMEARDVGGRRRSDWSNCDAMS